MNQMAHGYADALVRKSLRDEIGRLSAMLDGRAKESFEHLTAKDPVSSMTEENLRTMVNLLGRTLPSERVRLDGL